MFPPNVDLHTGQQQQLLYLSQVTLSTWQPHNLSPLDRLPIPTTVLSHLVLAISVEPRWLRGLIAERNCGISGGTQGTLAAFRRMIPVLILDRMLVQDTDLKMVIGSGTTTIGLGTGMSDLGEPPVSVGFSEEVALSRRV